MLVEDDLEVAEPVACGLREHGYEVSHAADGEGGYRLAATAQWQLVIFLTTMSGIDDRVDGLEAGANDYLVKPFASAERQARVRALTRRPAPGSGRETSLRAGDLEMDLLQRTVTRGTTAIDLLPQEFSLLEYLMRNANRVVSRAMLLENVWDIHFDPHASVVESHVSRLRAKLNVGSTCDVIETVRRTGYRLIG